MAEVPALLTVPEAAAYLKMTVGALRIAIHRGQVPGVVRIGRRVRIDATALARGLSDAR